MFYNLLLIKFGWRVNITLSLIYGIKPYLHCGVCLRFINDFYVKGMLFWNFILFLSIKFMSALPTFLMMNVNANYK